MEKKPVDSQKSSKAKQCSGYVKSGIWIFGISFWVFGITDRGIATLSDGYLSALDLTQLFIGVTFLLGWLSLKPNKVNKL
jgi:hypothetical protein